MHAAPIDPRTAYHAVRRAMTKVSPYSGPYLAARGISDAEGLARTALQCALGVEKLPRGAGFLPRQMAEAVLAAKARHKPRTLAERAAAWRRASYLAEAERRGLPTVLDLAKDGAMSLTMESEARTAEGYPVGLLRASGWARYSRRVGSYATSLALLCGRDDGGLWAVRVPGTITTAAEGLRWLEPAAVRKAREDGKSVLRQGDVYVVERKRGSDAMGDLPEGHRWDAETRTLIHGEHRHLHVPFPAMVVRQSTLAASGAGRRRGD